MFIVSSGTIYHVPPTRYLIPSKRQLPVTRYQATCTHSDRCTVVEVSALHYLRTFSLWLASFHMARHSRGSRSRSRSGKGEGKQRTKGKGKGKGGTRSRSRSVKGKGKQRTKGKGEGKDEEPRNVPPSSVYAQNSPKGDGKGAQQNFRHNVVRLRIDGDSPWTEADYVDAAAARWSSDEMMTLHVLIRGPIGMRGSMHEWLEARRDGLLHNWRGFSDGA